MDVPEFGYLRVEKEEDVVALLHSMAGALEAMPKIYKSPDQVPISKVREERLNRLVEELRRLANHYADALRDERRLLGHLYDRLNDARNHGDMLKPGVSDESILPIAKRLGYTTVNAIRISKAELDDCEMLVGQLECERDDRIDEAETVELTLIKSRRPVRDKFTDDEIELLAKIHAYVNSDELEKLQDLDLNPLRKRGWTIDEVIALRAGQLTRPQEIAALQYRLEHMGQGN